MNHFSLTPPPGPDNTGYIENFIEYIIQEFKIPEKLHARITLPVITAATFIACGNKNNP